MRHYVTCWIRTNISENLPIVFLPLACIEDGNRKFLEKCYALLFVLPETEEYS
jgi:hypothetical protein